MSARRGPKKRKRGGHPWDPFQPSRSTLVARDAERVYWAIRAGGDISADWRRVPWEELRDLDDLPEWRIHDALETLEKARLLRFCWVADGVLWVQQHAMAMAGV